MNIVLNAVQKQIELLVDAKNAIEVARMRSTSGRARDEYISALHRAEKEKQRLKDARFKLYDDLQKGLLDQDEYEHFRAKYKEEITTQEVTITHLLDSIASIKESRKADDEFIAFFEKYGNIQVIDRSVTTHLIDRVVVNDAKNISVYFKFSAECSRILNLARAV